MKSAATQTAYSSTAISWRWRDGQTAPTDYCPFGKVVTPLRLASSFFSLMTLTASTAAISALSLTNTSSAAGSSYGEMMGVRTQQTLAISLHKIKICRRWCQKKLFPLHLFDAFKRGRDIWA